MGSAGGQQVPISGISTVSRDPKAQEYWVKRFLAGVFVPGYSPRIFPFGAYFGTFAGLLLVLYFTIAEASYGKTIGKKVMGLRVAAEDGGRPTLGTSFLRNLSKINWVLLLLDVILGLALEVGYTKKFSDRFLRTSVTPV
jgi:uncharacterized RDD family membrane protein YckC